VEATTFVGNRFRSGMITNNSSVSVEVGLNAKRHGKIAQ
jgi:hypothetical protein